MSSLDDAFVGDDPDEEKLGEIINGRVKIISSKGEIRSDEKFSELGADQKIICCVAAVRAMELKDVRQEEKIGPTALAKICPVPHGTIGPKIKKIDVLESENGKYYLPGYNLDKTIEILEGEN